MLSRAIRTVRLPSIALSALVACLPCMLAVPASPAEAAAASPSPPVAAGIAAAVSGAPIRSTIFLSQTYTIDRKYRSMLGPQSTEFIYLAPEGSPAELLWVTGYEAVMVGPDGETPVSQEFMCHSNLDMNMPIHRKIFGIERETPNRLFTLSQGQQTIEFPEGFGVPVLSIEPFRLTTQVLNHNIEGQTFKVRHKVTVKWVRDSEVKTPMKALFQISANALVLVDGKDGYFNIADPNPEQHGPGCLPGDLATEKGRLFTDEFGRQFAGHWLVKPGREVNRSNTTHFMRLPYDTTLHYVAVHVHPFAESLELRDITAGKSVFLSRATGTKGKIGLDAVDPFSSTEGITLYKDHQYELVSIYDNTSGENQDSMAVMYMYVLDKEFRKPPLGVSPGPR